MNGYELSGYELRKLMREHQDEALRDVYILVGWRAGALTACAIIGRDNALEVWESGGELLGMSAMSLLNHRGRPVKSRGRLVSDGYGQDKATFIGRPV
jgi:hypothetical protein